MSLNQLHHWQLQDEQLEKDTKHDAEIAELKQQMAMLMANLPKAKNDETLHLKKA